MCVMIRVIPFLFLLQCVLSAFVFVSSLYCILSPTCTWSDFNFANLGEQLYKREKFASLSGQTGTAIFSQ